MVAELLQHEAVVVALIAAFVTLIGYLWNSKAQRDADARRFNAEQALARSKLEQQANVFRAIVLSELKSVSATFKSEIEFIEAEKFQTTWVPTIFSFKLVRENLLELGLLNPVEVQAILDAYYKYREHRWYIAAWSDPQAVTQLALDTPILFDLQDTKKRENLLYDLRAIIAAVDASIQVLDRQRPTTALQENSN